MNSSTNRPGALGLLVLEVVPVVAGAIIVAVGGIARSLLITGIGFFIIGLTNTILGMIEVTNWRGFAAQDGRYVRSRLASGWLRLASGVILLIVGILSFVVA